MATSEERVECSGPIAGIPVFGLDALSSAAYGLVSAFPRLQPHMPALCLLLLILTLVNMRVKDTGVDFLIPTYLFVGTLLFVIAVGACRAIAAHGHPLAIVAPPSFRSAVRCWVFGCWPRSSRVDALP